MEFTQQDEQPANYVCEDNVVKAVAEMRMDNEALKDRLASLQGQVAAQRGFQT